MMVRLHMVGVYLTDAEWSDFEDCCGMHSRQMLMVAATAAEQEE